MYSKYMGTDVGMVIDQRWPEPSRELDVIQQKQDKYIRDLLSNCRTAQDKAKSKGKEMKRLIIYIASAWPEMQTNVLELLGKLVSDGITEQKALLAAVKS
jgi:hypothetical protein